MVSISQFTDINVDIVGIVRIQEYLGYSNLQHMHIDEATVSQLEYGHSLTTVVKCFENVLRT